MSLNEEERKTMVVYRLEKAHQTMAEAELLFEHGLITGAANRLYYAAFYAVNALLIHSGIVTKSHDGAIRMFGQHFVKTGKIDKEYGKLYSNLFSNRITGDYEDHFDLTAEKLGNYFQPTCDFIAAIEQLVK